MFLLLLWYGFSSFLVTRHGVTFFKFMEATATISNFMRGQRYFSTQMKYWYLSSNKKNTFEVMLRNVPCAPRELKVAIARQCNIPDLRATGGVLRELLCCDEDYLDGDPSWKIDSESVSVRLNFNEVSQSKVITFTPFLVLCYFS